MEEKNCSREATMLQNLMALLPGFTTKCSTAQLKSVQHNNHDTPQICWCCWVFDENHEKYFAMFNPELNKVKTISENKKKTMIVKPVKS